MKQPFLGILLPAILATVIGGAVAIPFVYESQTLWYKVGLDKIVLLTGQVVGLLAFIALVLQIFLGIRGGLFEQAFGVSALVVYHRGNGLLLLCLAVLHIALVLVPEGLGNLPIGGKYWPEMVGGGLFLVLFLQVVFSLARQKFGFVYKRWRLVHRVFGYLALCLAGVHILFVADSFAHGFPRTALLGFLLLVVAAVFGVRISIWRRKI